MLRGLLVLMLFTGCVGHASASENMQQEIDHLLAFVRTSNCLIIRNGSQHQGEEAVAHMKKKFDYYREKVTSAELFIEYAASKSMMSGKPYQVQCEGRSVSTTRVWLLEELERFRLGS